MEEGKNKGFPKVVLIVVAVVVVLLAVVGYAATKNEPAPTASTEQDKFVTISEWGVQFPKSTSGKLSTNLQKDAKPQKVTEGPTDMEQLPIEVVGFDKNQSKCLSPDGITVGSIYRHKDENPTVKFDGKSEQWNLAPKAKVGDYWYSTGGLADSNTECLKGVTVPAEYETLRTIFVEDFKKLTAN